EALVSAHRSQIDDLAVLRPEDTPKPGPPSGSIRSVSEPPTMNPFWLIHEAPLLWTPGSDPRSAMTPFCHRKAWYPGDLSAIVDSERYCQFQAGVTISNQAVQLKDRAVLPQHRTVMQMVLAGLRTGFNH